MKTMYLTKVILLSAILSSSLVGHSIAEPGGETSGSGGGGSCLTGGSPAKPGDCRTLAETGFRLSNPALPDFEIDEKTLTALEDIRQQLPKWLQDDYTRAKVIGEKNTIITLDVENPEKVKVFTEEYKAIIRKQTPNFDFTHFPLLGFSLENRTYLIADKSRRMSNPFSRALLLIHEKNIRVDKTKVVDAIRLDGMFIDYMEAKRGNRLDQFDFWSFYRVLGEANLLDSRVARSLMVGDLVQKGMPINELISRSREGYGDIYPVYNQVLDLRRYHARIAQDLGDTQIYVAWTGERRENFLSLAYQELAMRGADRQLLSFSATAEQMNAWVTQYIAKQSRSVQEQILRGQTYCKDSQDKTRMYYLLAFDENTSRLAGFNCSIDKSVGDYDVPGQFKDLFFEGYVGNTFNFKGRITCSLVVKDRSRPTDKSVECNKK